MCPPHVGHDGHSLIGPQQHSEGRSVDDEGGGVSTDVARPFVSTRVQDHVGRWLVTRCCAGASGLRVNPLQHRALPRT